MKVVPVKLSDPLADALDELVKSGFYTSRNDALRDAVRFLIENKKLKKTDEKQRLQIELHAIARVVAAILLNKYGTAISQIVLFGSVAKGEVSEESDVDLLIIVKNGDRLRWRRRFIEEIVPLAYRIDHYISMKTFTKKEYKSLVDRGSLFIKEVLNHGIIIYRFKDRG